MKVIHTYEEWGEYNEGRTKSICNIELLVIPDFATTIEEAKSEEWRNIGILSTGA